MRIFATCLIKNEDDIIEQALLSAAEWADKIFVYDNGSTDKTWEIVNRLAKTHDNIIPWRQDTKHYKNNLFGEAYRANKQICEKGDWWVLLPADEIYIDNPKEFLAKVPERYHVVKMQSFDFQLTHEDVEEFDFREGDPFDDKKIRYYKPDTYTEVRFFRYRKRLVWPEGQYVPKHIGIVYPKKIRLKHFQHRSPSQIQTRLDIRRGLVETGYKFFRHASQASWKDKLMHRADLVKDEGDGVYRSTHIRYDTKSSPFVHFIKVVAHRLGIFP
ncbi:MAG: glycosyltransferase family 2 protein [Flavobacteriales bacterium]|nr:glycosyltransferase family 2 protein [Flavobacteriales bacterium]